MMKYLSILALLFITLGSCNENKEKNERLAQEEEIALEKTADSLEMVNIKMDSIEKTIQETSEEIDSILNDIDKN
ncbi:MAG: hypothetical protein Q8O62_07525 [Aequorivita sp.]|nr:hypothetical protein [Aequorivita sp.]